MLPLVCESGPSAARCHCNVTTELVWDGANAATAVGQHGQSLRIGNDWTPEVLFSVGVESDLMTTFLRLANEASLPVLAYVSAGHLVDLDDDGRHLVVSVCIVVESPAAVALAEDIWHEARTSARTAAMLSAQLAVETSIMAVGLTAVERLRT